MKILHGKTIRSGIAIGKAFILATTPEIKKAHIDDSLAEEKRLIQALGDLKKTMQDEAHAADEIAKDILETQIGILEDVNYLQAIYEAIFEEEVCAEYAAIACGEKFAKSLENLDNAYLRARAEDVRQVAKRLASAITGLTAQIELKEKAILVAEEFTPALLASLDRKLVLGLVAYKGSQSSHTAILASNYGLPYLTGINPEDVANDATVILDGEHACLIVDPDEKSKAWAMKKLEKEQVLLTNAPQSTKMKVYANISTLEDLELALENKADGIGLFRTEFLFMNRPEAPSEEEQFEVYRKALEKMQGKEVIIRTIDAGTDKPIPYLHMPKEENPALGMRGIRVSLKEKELFRVQLRALLRAAVYGELSVMFPMITSLREILEIKDQIKLAEEELKEAGKKYKMPKLGIMIETPAAALISEELAQHVDFFSLGTNDLTQYTLALDRQAEGLEECYEPHHEAIYKLIEITAQAAHDHGKTVGICGELGADDNALKRLVTIGLDEVSVGAALVPKCRRIIAKAEGEPVAGDEVNTLSAEQEMFASDEEIASPVDGKLIAMGSIPDETFAQGVLGPCFAVEPASGNICAPISGTVISIAETKHAVIIRSARGVEVLVHIGLDTVKLEGTPFEVMVSENQKVAKGELLVKADLQAIKDGGCSTITPVVLCNLDE